MKIYVMCFASDEDANATMDDSFGNIKRELVELMLSPGRPFTSKERAAAAAQEQFEELRNEYNDDEMNEDEQLPPAEFVFFPEQGTTNRWVSTIETGYGNYYASIVEFELEDPTT